MAKKYLEKEELAVLIQYINDSLAAKVGIGEIPEIELPNDLVNNTALAAALIPYAKKNEVVSQLPNDLVYEAELDNYAPLSALDSYALASDLTTLEGRLNGVYHFKGSVANLAALENVQNPAEGDVYNLEDTGMNAAWTGSAWDEFGTIVDLTGYVKEEDVQEITRAELNTMLYSGKSAIVNNADALLAMISNDEDEVEITLNKDISNLSTVTIPEGKKVTLDLGGNNVVSTSTAIYVNGGELEIKNGNLTSNSNPTIMAQNGATVTIDGANITSSHHNGVNATEAEVIMNSGSITSQEAGIAGFKDSTIIINGGTLTGIDNGGLMGNGSKPGAANDGTNMNVIMNGGKIVGHITSAGYQACGVYVPNTGSFIMNGGEIESDGAGIVMRGGLVHIEANAKITATGPAGFVGKVGDSVVNVGSYGIVYDATSNYPGVSSLELIIDNGATITGTDGDISTVLPDGATANITDNRA